MAKITNCAICGKEITKGFLSGDADTLSFSLDVSITCCEECAKTFKDPEVFDHARFAKKIYNYKKVTKRKLTDGEIGRMFVQYTSDIQNHRNSKYFETEIAYNGFYHCDGNGNFSVKEFQLGFINSDVSVNDMAKSIIASQLIRGGEGVFDKNDISKIAYRRKGIGDPCGLFSVAYTYDIILNDEATFTYKPGMTRVAVIGRGLPFLWVFSANKKVKNILNEFKEDIGSDLIIEKAR